MKTAKQLLLGVAFVLVSGAVMATGNLKVDILQGEKENTVVQISNNAESIFEIELKNNDGNIIYYKRTESPAAACRQYFDFSRIADGQYQLTVSIDSEKKENTLKINNGQVDLVNQRKELEPYFTVRDNRLELSYLNFELDDVNLMVYKNGELLYEKDLEPEFAVNYGLDLSNLNAGDYNAILSTENSTYNYLISKE